MFDQRLALFEQLRLAAISLLQSFDHRLLNPAFDAAPLLAGSALRAQRTMSASLGRIDLELLVYGFVGGRILKRQLLALRANINISLWFITKLVLPEDTQPLGFL